MDHARDACDPRKGGRSSGSATMRCIENAWKRENMKPREGKHETLDAVAGSKARMWFLVGNVRV